MTARLPQTAEPLAPDAALPSRTPRPGWRSAWRALRRLVEDPERTDAVFDLIDALPDRSHERALRRLRADPDGAALLARRHSLRAALADPDALAALPDGSLGRAYARFMRAERLRAEGLVAADEGRGHANRDRAPDEAGDDDAAHWLGERMRDLHDLFHVLTGYGSDEAGEVANLAFTYAQFPNRGVGLIVLAGMVLGPKSRGLAWQRYLLCAFRRGRRARPVAHAPLEDWLALPLDEVRRRLRIEPPERAHPGGIAVGVRLGPARWGAR